MNATAAPDPMAAARVLAEMRAAGFEILASGDSLRVAPAESLTDSQRATLRAHKSALINLLTDTDASARALTDADLSTPPPALAPEVRCSDCHHGQPATPSDPWSWHLCATGAIRAHGWGMAARRCGRWEVKP